MEKAFSIMYEDKKFKMAATVCPVDLFVVVAPLQNLSGLILSFSNARMQALGSTKYIHYRL